jgi:branched-chain amino acid aminotransferase
MSYFFYNNQFYTDTETVLSPFDRGFSLGDGVFETIRVTDSKPELWQQHLYRLGQGCKIFHLNIPDDLYDNALKLIEKNKTASAVLKITVSRHSNKRGLAISGCHKANVTLTLSELPPAPKNIKAMISEIKRNDMSPLSRIKSLNYGDNLLAFNEAVSKGYDDALMLNTKNQPCCFTVGNIVMQNKQGDLVTPPCETGCLGGSFLTTLKNLKYQNFELTEAVKVWRSNSISGLVPVTLECNQET